MSTVVVVNGRNQAVPVWHPEFLAHVLPAVEAVARTRFRDLPSVDREEATAEAVAGALVSFVRLIRRGRKPTVFAGRLAVIAVLRVMAGRLTSTSDNSQDAMSRLARQRRGFTVERLPDSTQAESDWEAILVDDGKCSPAELAASRIDFADWLGRMSRRRRKIAEALAAGFRTEEVARLFNLSRGRISQLRRELEANWREFQHEANQSVAGEYPAAA
jgi:hypothetical protein